MNRPLYVYALAVVGVFAALGAGIGLAANFTLGFFIEQFVDPGQDPLDVTQVGILFLATILLLYVASPFVAGVAGICVGQALPDRRGGAAIVAGVGSFVGVFLFVGLGLFFTMTVLMEYGAPMGGSGEVEAEGGNGGGGEGPLDPSELGTLMLQVSLPVALVGMASAYLASLITARTGNRPSPDGAVAGSEAGTSEDPAVTGETPTAEEPALPEDRAAAEE